MKTLLTVTAVIEAGTGVALAIAPSAVALGLLGSPLDSPSGLVIGRVLGTALFSLGAVCWLARNETQSRIAVGLIAVMMFYHIAAVFLFGYARISLGISGIGLWPAVILHTVMSVWCVVCLRVARPK